MATVWNFQEQCTGCELTWPDVAKFGGEGGELRVVNNNYPSKKIQIITNTVWKHSYSL